MGVPMEGPAFVSAVQEVLGQVQESLLASATAFRDDNIVDVFSYEELKAVVAEGKQGGTTCSGGWRHPPPPGVSGHTACVLSSAHAVRQFHAVQFCRMQSGMAMATSCCFNMTVSGVTARGHGLFAGWQQ
jgi:hypothetical protein